MLSARGLVDAGNIEFGCYPIALLVILCDWYAYGVV